VSVTEPSIGAKTAASILKWSQKREVHACSRSMRSRNTTVSNSKANRTPESVANKGLFPQGDVEVVRQTSGKSDRERRVWICF
jgi:hypothetical protein